jgi:capsular polysaccharide biosynthesis protein
MQDDLDLLKSYKQIIKRWWVIVLAAFIGGLLAFGFSYLKPGWYQAEAVFHASIDFTEINFENLQSGNNAPLTFTQYDEDLALQVVQRMLLATRNEAFRYAQTLDPDLDITTFVRNSQIRRYHAQWYLRYRHTDPEIAQSIVNYWADLGWQALQDAQENGKAEPFVIVDLVSKADLPQVDIYLNRNNLILAGTLIGFVAGVVLVDFSQRVRGKAVRTA